MFFSVTKRSQIWGLCAAIPGDGIGIEVIAAGLKVLDVVASRVKGFRLEVEHFPWSSEYYLKHGHYIPEGGLEKLKTFHTT